MLNILIVEDEPSNREIATVILSRLGHRVWTCSNGQEALEFLIDQRKPCDLVLMDVLMPVVDGLSAIRALRKHPATRWLPIVCVSARASRLDHETGYAAGCDRYLSKPYPRRELLRVIDEALIEKDRLPAGRSIADPMELPYAL